MSAMHLRKGSIDKCDAINHIAVSIRDLKFKPGSSTTANKGELAKLMANLGLNTTSTDMVIFDQPGGEYDNRSMTGGHLGSPEVTG